MELYDMVSPLDYRYYGDDREFFERLRPYVSEGANIRYMLKVEAALVRELAERGVCPEKAADEVERACSEITPREVYEEERRIQHNIRALVNCIRRRISPESRPYVHLFATSCDIMDTATALRFKELTEDVLIPDLIGLEELLIGMARETADVPQIGRTHGQHAEPITFGFALALYVDRLGGRIEKLDEARRNLRGKFSGAVGAYNALSLLEGIDPSEFESSLLGRLGLKPSGISSQIVEPEYLVDLVCSAVSCFSVLANLADDMRHLMRTEIAEVRDRKGEERVGSSTMPHKVNPKDFENVKSMWKAFMPRIVTVLMDQISEHQRDLTNSASGRFVTEIFTALDYAVHRTVKALRNIEVDRERVRENLEMSKGFIVAEPLYILLALEGYPDAYDRTKKLVAEARRSGRPLPEIVWEDEEIRPFLEGLPEEKKEVLRDPSLYTGDATRRTLETCEYWEGRCKVLKEKLGRWGGKTCAP